MSLESNDADLEFTVANLIAGNNTYYSVLNEIVKTDKQFIGNEDDMLGWSFDDIDGFSGGMVNVLLKSEIIKYVYKTNSTKLFRLAIDQEKMEEILSNIDCPSDDRKENKEPMIIIEEEQINKWKDLISGGTEMVDYWASKINPKVEGMLYEKTAVLLMLASPGDVFGDRGRIHILMYGDPGTAKSELRDWVISQIGAISCGQRTSDVGLTGDARGGEIAPGALAQADNSVLCLDELDKFDNKDRQSLLTAMEEGFVEIRAGGKSARFDARCKVFACANTITPFSPELIDRFDFKIDCKLPSAERTKEIMTSIVQSWYREKDGYYGIELKAFLYWIRDYVPEISQKSRDAISILMQIFIDLDSAENQSIRRRESILRVMITVAKLHRRSVVPSDFITAVKILHPTFNGGKMEALTFSLRSLLA